MTVALRSILLVDCDAERRSAAALALRATGWQVVEASGALDAIKSSNGTFDLVVADLNAVDAAALAKAIDEARNATQSTEASKTNSSPSAALRNLAHDLRTPLNAILGWAQLLKFGELNDAMKHEALDV